MKKKEEEKNDKKKDWSLFSDDVDDARNILFCFFILLVKYQLNLS